MRAAEALARMRALPIADLDAILAPGPLLVLAPHPDDESLGCGGLIATAVARRRAVHVAVLTDGTGSHPNSVAFPAPRLAAVRQAEARAACAALGVPADAVYFIGATDTKVPRDGPAFEGVRDALAELIRDCGVATVLTTWRHDPHCDHAAASALVSALDVARRAFPVWGFTLDDATEVGEVEGWRLDVTPVLDAKRRAIAAHVSQTTSLITDDPGAFRLSDDFLANFTGRYEIVLRG